MHSMYSREELPCKRRAKRGAKYREGLPARGAELRKWDVCSLSPIAEISRTLTANTGTAGNRSTEKAEFRPEIRRASQGIRKISALNGDAIRRMRNIRVSGSFPAARTRLSESHVRAARTPKEDRSRARHRACARRLRLTTF